MRSLNVWWDTQLVGQLTQNQHGELGFAYAPEWLEDEECKAPIRLIAKTGGAIRAPRVPAVLWRAFAR